MNNIVKIASNYGSRLWSLVSVFIFIPFYIKFLGVESYAVISFYTLLLGLIGFIDSGMSSAVLKEFSKEESANYKYSILKQTEKIYFSISLILVIIFFFSSDLISESWLVSKEIESIRISYYIKLICIGIIFQLISSMYYGALFGLGFQVKANIFQIIWSVFRSGLIVVLFFLFKPSLEFFFIWQIICNILYVLLLRSNVIFKLRKENIKLVSYLKKLPKNILNYIVSVTFLAILVSVNTFVDRLIVSKNFTLEVFGYYSISSIISQVPILFTSPLILFVFPLLSKYYGKKDINKVLEIFDRVILLSLLLITPLTVGVFYYANEIVFLWTSGTINVDQVDNIGRITSYLIIGAYFGALLIPLNYIILATEKTKYTVYINLVQVIVGSCLLYILSLKFGLLGIGVGWIVINILTLIALTIIVKVKVLEINLMKHFKRLILFILLSILFFYSVKIIHLNFEYNFIYFIVVSFFLSLSSSIIITMKINNMRLKDLFNFPK